MLDPLLIFRMLLLEIIDRFEGMIVLVKDAVVLEFVGLGELAGLDLLQLKLQF